MTSEQLLRDAVELRYKANQLVKTLTQIHHKSKEPYSGYYGFDWTVQNDTLIIEQWTYGGYMDGSQQDLETLRIPLSDIDHMLLSATDFT